MDKVINTTPHDITILLHGTDARMVLSRSLNPVRVTTKVVDTGREVRGVPVTRMEIGEIENLPDPQPGTYFLVSRLIAELVRDRSDLLIVNETVRDDHGRIIGCKSFGVL